MKTIISILLIIFLTSCSSQKVVSERALKKNQEDGFVHFYKVQSFCSCIRQAYENKQITELMQKEDLLGSYDELANQLFQKQIDSLAKNVAQGIKKETYEDFEGKKRIAETCLTFYTSKKLDSLAHVTYKRLTKDQK